MEMDKFFYVTFIWLIAAKFIDNILCSSRSQARYRVFLNPFLIRTHTHSFLNIRNAYPHTVRGIDAGTHAVWRRAVQPCPDRSNLYFHRVRTLVALYLYKENFCYAPS